jgi:hypothetical protein
LNPADPWVSYLLAGTYQRYGLRTGRVHSLLREAFERYDTVVDPAAQRYYAITKADIEQALAELKSED